MSVFGLLSAKGSPGATTVAAALATVESASGGEAVWIELDPSGGTGRIQTGTEAAPTLTDLARALREQRRTSELLELVAEAPQGVGAFLAPPGAVAAGTVIREGGRAWGPALRALPGSVFVDLGRWDPGQPTADRVGAVDVLGVICRSTVESVSHLQALLPELRRHAQCPVALVVVGSSPYPGPQIAGLLGLPLAGVLEWRRGDVTALWARGAARNGMIRSPLGRGAVATLEGLVGQLAPRHAVAPVPGHRMGERP